MIERLMDPGIRYGGSEYSITTDEILKIQKKLAVKLDDTDFELLDRLSELLTHRTTVELEGAFTHGFCAAVELMLEYRHWKDS